MLWSIPFLLLSYFITKNPYALMAFLLSSLSCSIMNVNYGMLDSRIVGTWGLLLAISMLAFTISTIINSRKQKQ